MDILLYFTLSWILAKIQDNVIDSINFKLSIFSCKLKTLNIIFFNNQECLNFDYMFENCEGMELYINGNICPNLIEHIPQYVNYHDIIED